MQLKEYSSMSPAITHNILLVLLFVLLCFKGSHHRTKPTITGRVVQENSSVGVFVVVLQHTGLRHWGNSSAHTCLLLSFKTTIELPLLRVLGKMLQLKTAGPPYCPVHPCANAEHGQAGKGESRCVAALSKHLQEQVCVCWEVFVSQLSLGIATDTLQILRT